MGASVSHPPTTLAQHAPQQRQHAPHRQQQQPQQHLSPASTRRPTLRPPVTHYAPQTTTLVAPPVPESLDDTGFGGGKHMDDVKEAEEAEGKPMAPHLVSTVHGDNGRTRHLHQRPPTPPLPATRVEDAVVAMVADECGNSMVRCIAATADADHPHRTSHAPQYRLGGGGGGVGRVAIPTASRPTMPPPPPPTPGDGSEASDGVSDVGSMADSETAFLPQISDSRGDVPGAFRKTTVPLLCTRSGNGGAAVASAGGGSGAGGGPQQYTVIHAAHRIQFDTNDLDTQCDELECIDAS